MFSVGPFDATRRLGQGGMGEVWAGVHRASGLPVAIKLVSVPAGRGPLEVDGRADRAELWRVRFRHEVEAVAALDHPGIVTVYDRGETSDGTPYLVMELLGRGSLETYVPADYAEVHAILLDVLDALAHAHARGVVHRDLKPANVLVADDGRSVLTDFGIAHAMEADRAETGRASGTPIFMAPEQFRGEWRAHGPWTDLYALGVTAWVLLTGQPPFDGDPPALRQAHAWRELPLLVPRFAVPDGVEAWLRALLEKDPAARPACAADAAAALPGPFAPRSSSSPSSRGATVPAAEGRTWTTLAPLLDTVESMTLDAEPTEEDHRTAPAARRLPAPPMPKTWRSPGDVSRRLHLIGAGLGLFGLRAIPMVDRETERNALWDALSDVRETGLTRVVVLRGASGQGTTRLARWLAERAQEVGAATSMSATYGPGTSRSHGLAAMFRRRLAVEGLSGPVLALQADGALARLGVDDPDVRALGADVATAPRPGSLARVLGALALRRPVVVVLDDVPWGEEGLAFARFLAQRRAVSPLACLVVATVRDDVLAERPDARAAVDGLLRLPGTSMIDVGPLSAGDTRVLVRELLGLRGSLAAQVEERSAGNPSYAVALVRGWIADRLLVPHERGFDVVRGAEAHVPGDLRAAWSSRVERLLTAWSPDDVVAIELAAFLGQDVDGGEWGAACALAGVEPSDRVVAGLEAASLGHRTERGFSFTGPMVRDAIVDRAADRAPERHLQCADALAARPDTPRVDERVGRHLFAAGDWERAERRLLAAARLRQGDGDARRATALLEEWGYVVERLGLPADDRRVAEGVIARAMALANAGEIEASAVTAEQAVEIAERVGDRTIVSNAYRARGHALVRLAHVDEGLRAWERALALAETEMDRSAAWRGLGYALQVAGDLDGAERCFVAVRDSTGSEPYGVASALNSLAEIARIRGDLDAAARGYEAAMALTEDSWRADGAIAALNHAVVILTRGRYAEARARLEALRDEGEREAWDLVVAASLAWLLPCYAEERAWSGWDMAMRRTAHLLSTTGLVESDIADALTRAADLALRHGHEARARAAWLLALDQWRKLQRPEEARRVEKALEGL